MSRARRAVAVLVLFACALRMAACTTVVPQSASPGAVAPREFPRTVSLVLRDGARVDLFSARLEGDSIRGERRDTGATAVAAADVVRWEARRFSPGRTLAAVAATTLTVVGLWLIMYDGPIEALHQPGS